MKNNIGVQTDFFSEIIALLKSYILRRQQEML